MQSTLSRQLIIDEIKSASRLDGNSEKKHCLSEILNEVLFKLGICEICHGLLDLIVQSVQSIDIEKCSVSS